jgi:hypothetical protein
MNKAALSDQRIGSNDYDADKYFDPLQAACETRQARLMEIALEGMKYLIGTTFSLLLVRSSHGLPLQITAT